MTRDEKIRAMAEKYADPKFRYQSFRWQHMVRIYIDAINEWDVERLKGLQYEAQSKQPFSMPDQPQEPL